MPEGVELRILADKLQRYTGKKITKIEYSEKSRFSKKPIVGIDNISYPLIIKDIWSRGKILVFECNGVYLISHLGMSGVWTSKKGDHSDLWFVLEGEKLYFDDMRHFGNFTICQDLSCIWKKHGPCLLSTALQKFDNRSLNEHQEIVTYDYFLEKINYSRIKNKKICMFLMEQKYVSGVGNYLRAEILYRCKISPHRKLIDLNDEEKKTIYEICLKTVYSAYKTQGPSDGYYPEGSFELFVYGQTKDPLGNSVVREKDVSKRTIHWVPQIQK